MCETNYVSYVCRVIVCTELSLLPSTCVKEKRAWKLKNVSTKILDEEVKSSGWKEHYNIEGELFPACIHTMITSEYIKTVMDLHSLVISHHVTQNDVCLLKQKSQRQLVFLATIVFESSHQTKNDWRKSFIFQSMCKYEN